MPEGAYEGHLFRFDGHGIAILVHQGSDPTLPYQALVTRKSAKLFGGRSEERRVGKEC